MSNEQKFIISDMGKDEFGSFFAEISLGEKVLFQIQSNDSAEIVDSSAVRMIECANALAGIEDVAGWMKSQNDTLFKVSNDLVKTIDELEDGNIPSDDQLISILEYVQSEITKVNNLFPTPAKEKGIK